MKRYILLLMLLSCSAVWAQDVVRDSTAVADTADTEENVIGARPQRPKKGKQEANVLGDPVYYDVNGSERGDGEGRRTYRRPRHHYLNSLDDRYCSVFFESELLFGVNDAALGFNLTVLPERWGGYGAMLFGLRENYFSVGPALRLSSYESSMDWQLYGGAVFTQRHLGGEVGIRMALSQTTSRFCWLSTSLGVSVVDGDVYGTLGLSVVLAGIALLGL